MTDASSQSFKNHARIDPAFHYALTCLLLVALGLSITFLLRHPSLESALLLVLTLALMLNSSLTRTYPLKVQDRVIRLEEQLRLVLLLPEELKPRISELTHQQLVALRFASDAELPALVTRTLQAGLTKKQIKESIQTWRPDYLRV